MRSYRLLFILIPVMVAAANISLTDLLSELPQCSLSCIISGLGSSPTAFGNPTTICTNNTLQATLSACIQKSCNFTEQAQVIIANNQLCAGTPIKSRTLDVSIAGFVCVPLALIAIAIRCYARLRIVLQFGFDDWLMVVTASFLVTLVVLDIYDCMANGFGRHIWNVNPLKAEQLLKIFYAVEVLYVTVITLIKTSILLFYLRVFPALWFKRMVYTTIAIVVASGLAISLSTIFQCVPMAGAWNRSIPSKCINVNLLAYASGGIGIGLDVVILILPIRECLNLHMNMTKKLNVIFMFSIGSLACITSAVRLKYITAFASSFDSTWDNSIPAIWSLIEICVATICACLPAMRAILSLWLPSIFDIDTSASSNINHPPSFNLKPPTDSGPSISEGTQVYRSDKVGPSYSKRVILDPDDDFLSTLDEPINTSSSSTKKVWINPRFDTQNQMIPIPPVPLKQKSRAASECSSTMIVMQGPRESEEMLDLEDGRGPGVAIQMRQFATMKVDAESSGSIRSAKSMESVPSLSLGENFGKRYSPYWRLGSMDDVRHSRGSKSWSHN